MTTKIITATTAIAKAFSQPQSKKCLISASQTMNITIAAINPPTKAPSTAPITVPRTAIQRASVNFALSLPASSLPAIHSTGASITAATTIYINIPTGSIAILSNPLVATLVLSIYKLKHTVDRNSFLLRNRNSNNTHRWRLAAICTLVFLQSCRL